MAMTLNKPAGVPVFPPHAQADGDCMLRRLLADQPWRMEIVWPQGFAGGIAHRLDNATSGAVLVADSPTELMTFRDWFRLHKFTKTYWLLAAGDVPWNDNACAASIAHHPMRKSKMVVMRGRRGATPHRGKWYPAHTRFHRVAGNLWEATITTGVTHQIRVHAAFVGIPLLGDRLYGGASVVDAAQPDGTFHLHHVGLRGPDGFRTAPVPPPTWALT